MGTQTEELPMLEKFPTEEADSENAAKQRKLLDTIHSDSNMTFMAQEFDICKSMRRYDILFFACNGRELHTYCNIKNSTISSEEGR